MPACRRFAKRNMTNNTLTTAPKTGRRAKIRTIFMWTQDFLRKTPVLKDQAVKAFESRSGAKYAMHTASGAFVRIDKDRRSPKARKAANRAERARREALALEPTSL